MALQDGHGWLPLHLVLRFRHESQATRTFLRRVLPYACRSPWLRSSSAWQASRWSFLTSARRKAWSQQGHLKGLSLVWVLRCRCKCSERAKRAWQISHVLFLTMCVGWTVPTGMLGCISVRKQSWFLDVVSNGRPFRFVAATQTEVWQGHDAKTRQRRIS